MGKFIQDAIYGHHLLNLTFDNTIHLTSDITNEPVDYMALDPYDFAAGQRHYLGHWKGWAMKVSTLTLPMAS